MKKTVFLFSALSLSLSGWGQNVGINNTGANPNASAMLDVVSTNKGVLVPRVALTATNAAGPITAPATSLLVYNTATAGAGSTAVTPGFYYWNGSAWIRFSEEGTDWKITGNDNATSGTNFLGTTNAQALDFRTNNSIRFRVANGDQVYAINNGTSAAPFYSWNGDTDMGIYRIGANDLGISTGGVERASISAAATIFNETSTDTDFRIESDGNANMFFLDAGNNRVSIASANNAVEFNVTGESYFSDDIWLRDGAVNAGDFLVRIYDSGDDGVIDVYQNNAFNHRIHGNGTTIFNEQGLDLDFRIEGDNEANLFYVDAGSDAIGFQSVPNALTLTGLVTNQIYAPVEVGNDGGTGVQVGVGYYFGSDPAVLPEVANYGYVGSAAYYWYYMYSNNYVNVSRRETKRDFVQIDQNKEVEDYLMTSLDKMSTYLYKYKFENDHPEDGIDKYRPQYHLGVIVDEAPDVVQDVAFSGIDIYALSTLAITGVKSNRAQIQELKSKQANDFGTTVLSGTQSFVTYSDDFKGVISASNLPVITLTSNQPDVVLSVTEKNEDGFMITASKEVDELMVDWIGYAKVVHEGNSEKQSEIDSKILEQLEIPAETKQKLNQLHSQPPVQHNEERNW